jgi:hypothetical protein
MKLGEKSAAADRTEVRLARDSMGLYTLQSLEYWEADDISDEDEFPKFGDFLQCRTTTGGPDPEWNVEVFVECPLGLEQELLELGIEDGDSFRIQQVSKDTDGEWTYQVVEDSLPD